MQDTNPAAVIPALRSVIASGAKQSIWIAASGLAAFLAGDGWRQNKLKETMQNQLLGHPHPDKKTQTN